MHKSSFGIKSKFTSIMLAPLLSKAGLNSIFSLFLAFVAIPLLIGDSHSKASIIVATLPALLICAGFWFNFTNRIYS